MRSFDRVLSLFGLSALIAALAIGLGVIDRPTDEAVSWPVAAWVNGEPIAEVRYASTLLAMQNNLKRTLTTDDRLNAMERLVDEELMLQYALGLGLARNDSLVRKNLIQAVVQSLSLQTEDVDEQTLRDFFVRERARFLPEVKVSVQVRTTPSPTVAAAFAKALAAGYGFVEAADAAELESVALAEKLPLHQIALHLGGTARAHIKTMAEGDIIGPLTINERHVFIWLIEKEAKATNYEDVQDQVQAAWRRQAQTNAINRHLDTLRAKASIRYQVTPEQPYLR